MGYLRFSLSIIVFHAHSTEPGGHYVWANIAVFIFYAMAGYLATLQCREQYKGDPLLYLWRRLSRVYPLYFVVFVLTLIAMSIGIVGQRIVFIDLGNIVPQLFLVIPRAAYGGAIIPQGWMIPWLLLGYACISLGASRTMQRTLICLVISFAWAQYAALTLDWVGYYRSFAPWALSFSVGAAAYWMGWVMPKDKGLSALAGRLSYSVYLCHFLIIDALNRWIELGNGLFFASLLPTIALSWFLARYIEQPISTWRLK